MCHAQVINEVDKVRMDDDGIPMEAKVTEGLSHPSIVRMHAFKLIHDMLLEEHASRQIHAKAKELWIILDFCDKGTIQVAF